jgi:outer membrane protein with beta-barrel domain
MKGTLRAASATGLLLTFAALGLQAQARVILGLGGGVIIPMKSGFNAVESPPLSVKSIGFGGQFMVGILPSPASKVSIRLDLAYANAHYKTPSPARDRDPKMSIRNINMDLVIHPSNAGNVRPYFMAGPTVVSWDYRTGETSSTSGGTGAVKGSFGFNAGAGIEFGAGKVFWFFAESRYIWTKRQAVAVVDNVGTPKGTAFIPIAIGIRIKPMEGQ